MVTNSLSQGPQKDLGTGIRRLVVFCGKSPPPSTTEAVEAIADAHPDWRVLIVQSRGQRRQFWPYLKSKLRRLAREPLSYPLEILCETWAKIHLPRRRRVGGRVGLPPLHDLHRDNVMHYAAGSIHSEETLRTVREYRPWLGISLAAPILKPCLFDIPAIGTINVHKSYLPDYRGMPPGFWEFHDGQQSTGVSVHWVASALDAGDIISQARLAIPPYAVPDSIGPQLDQLTIPLLLSVLRQLDSGEQPHQAQGQSRTATRSRPPFLLACRVKRAFARTRSPVSGFLTRMRGLAKTGVLAAYVHLWAPVRNWVNGLRGKSHVAVLLWHRVDDGFLDDITVGVAQFREQVRLLKRSYDILDMPEFLASRRAPRNRPAVVITFDDGYESDHLAALLLRREGIPATFFVSTRIVGTDRGFPHDIQKLGRSVPSLSWDQIIEMAKWGFHIGPHTANHANVGKIPLEDAQAEIKGSVDDLVARLGCMGPQKWFSYPYGKPGDISAAVRDVLRQMGIEFCLSAYGGTNSPDFDPLDIRRQGVDWKFSLLALRASVEGWKVT